MTRRRAILLIAVGETLIWASVFYVFPPLLLDWERDTGWSKPGLTAAITLALLASALAAPVAGRIVDAGRGPVMMAVAPVMAGICLAALTQVTALWQFQLLWALIGFCMAGSLYDPAFAIVTRALGAKAKDAIIPITLVAGFAGTIAFPATHALSGALGWRATLGVAGAVAALVAAPLLWAGARGIAATGEAPADAGPDHAAAPPRRAFLHRSEFWLLALAFACAALVQSGTIQHLLPYLDERGLAPDTAVLAAAFIGPMQVSGRLAMMVSARLASHHQVALAAFAATALALALLLSGGGAVPALAGFVLLFGGAFGTMSILRPVLTRDILGGRDFGAKAGALAMPYLVASATAPWLASLGWGLGGYRLVFTVAVGLALAGGAFYLAAHVTAMHRSA